MLVIVAHVVVVFAVAVAVHVVVVLVIVVIGVSCGLCGACGFHLARSSAHVTQSRPTRMQPVMDGGEGVEGERREVWEMG